MRALNILSFRNIFYSTCMPPEISPPIYKPKTPYDQVIKAQGFNVGFYNRNASEKGIRIH